MTRRISCARVVRGSWPDVFTRLEDGADFSGPDLSGTHGGGDPDGSDPDAVATWEATFEGAGSAK
jgi:hypothetical protein